jgi:hypothetical protein
VEKNAFYLFFFQQKGERQPTQKFQKIGKTNISLVRWQLFQIEFWLT